jgi:hypothetical protein
MKNTSLFWAMGIQLIIILGLFSYFYTQKRNTDQVVYLSVVNTNIETDKLHLQLNTIEDYVLQSNRFQSIPAVDFQIQIGDIVYLTLNQYGGQTHQIESGSMVYPEERNHLVIQGKITNITQSTGGDYQTFQIEYGIENIPSPIESLDGAIAKVSLDSTGKATLRNIYKGNKILYSLD